MSILLRRRIANISPSFVYSVTVGASETIALPMFNGDDSLYDFIVNFGDLTSDKVVNAYADTDRQHTYVGAGTYDIKITGQFDYIKFIDSPNSIIELKSFGGSAIGEVSFNGCSNFAIISATDTPGMYLTSLNECFRDCSVLATTNNISNWDVSTIIDMGSMFFGSTVFNGTIDNWNVSLVTDMSSLFAEASTFNQPLSSWNTGAVITMHSMFLRAEAFNKDVSDWDMSNVTTTALMFQECDVYNNGGVALNWSDTSSMININSMFRQCPLFNVSVAGWDVSNVTNFSSLFFSALIFNQSLSSWSTVAATNMSGMFVSASAFNQSLSTFTTTLVISMSSMFQSANAFNQDISGWNVSAVTTMDNMFFNNTTFNNGGTALNWANTGALATINGMFQNATAFNQDISAWDVTSLTSATTFLNGTSISTANYDLALVAWDAQVLQSGVNADFGSSTYTLLSSADTARANMISVDLWIITDGGGI